MAKKVKSMIFSGKRKTAVAKVRFKEGTGKITYNKLGFDALPLFHRLSLLEPIRIYEEELGEKIAFDFTIATQSGGREAQVQAARLAIAKLLIHQSGSTVLRKAFVKYDRNMVVPDSRRKETCKPGDSKARAKRQKSFR